MAELIRWLKQASRPELSYDMHGSLYVSKSGWLLMQVPNAIGRGAFDALKEPTAELPLGSNDRYNAHISVMTAEEVEGLGGADAIKERGQSFSYTTGSVRTVKPRGWGGVSKVWFIECYSPELKNLRKSYGLTPLPHGDHQFHCTFAIRRTAGVDLQPADRAGQKAAYFLAVGDCEGCGFPWPSCVCGAICEKTAAAEPGLLRQLILDPAIRTFLKTQGMVQGESGVNIWDSLQKQNEQSANWNARMSAATKDLPQLQSLASGLQHAVGLKQTPLPGDVAKYLPLLQASNPELYDQVVPQSRVGLVQALAGNKAVDPQQLAPVADEIMQHAGESGLNGRESGQVLTGLMARGLLNPVNQVESFRSWAGPIQAVRESAARNGVRLSVPDAVAHVEQAIGKGQPASGLRGPRLAESLRSQFNLAEQLPGEKPDVSAARLALMRSGSTSQAANTLGAIQRLNSVSPAKPGTDAASLVAALSGGEGTWKNTQGQDRPVRVDPAEFSSLFASRGVNPASFLQDTASNLEYSSGNPAIQKMQAAEFAGDADRVAGVGAGQAIRQGQPEGVRPSLLAHIQARHPQRDAAWHATAAEQLYGRLDTMANNYVPGGLQTALQLHGGPAVAGREQAAQHATNTAKLQGAAGRTTGSVLEGVGEGLRAFDPQAKSPWGDFAARALGGVKFESNKR